MNDVENSLMYKTLFKLLSHDTRNTFVKLNALIGELEGCAVRDMISDSVRELYELIASSAGFIDGKRRILSVYDLVSDLTLTEDKITLTNHKRIVFNFDPKIYLFSEVSELFNHAILNIVENALKYSPENEKIDITLKRDNNLIVIQVKDLGIGIDDSEKEKVFEQGYRTKQVENVEGTGIGLWITKNIIQRDGGKVTILDNSPRGSIFKVEIPAFHTEDIEESMDIIIKNYISDPVELGKSIKSVETLIDLHNPPKEYDYNSLVFSNLLNYVRKERRNKGASHFKDRLLEIKSKNPQGKTVLIVDDSAYVHYYLGSFFSELGYRVLDYGFNGEEGCNLYETHKPDLVTLDITMPIMSGIEAGDKILSLNPKANIMFLSGLGSHKGLVNNIQKKLKCNDFTILTKPFTKEKLEEALNNFSF